MVDEAIRQHIEGGIMGEGGSTAIVIGAGIVGAATSLELARRGWEVRLIEAGPVPRPEASSTDRSKIIRMDYGADRFMTGLAAEAMEGWDRWNRELFDRPLYHQTGFLLLSSEPLRSGSFEGDSWETLRRRVALERLDYRGLEGRFPALNPERIVDGYCNPRAGWAESGEALRQVVQAALRECVELRRDRVTKLVTEGGRVTGVEVGTGTARRADAVVLAAGAWSPRLAPAPGFEVRGMPVLYFRPRDPEPFRAERLPVWAADIGRSGWYGFPVGDDGIVKVANHGLGQAGDPDRPESASPKWEERARAFLEDWIPELAEAPLVGSRTCFYCDSRDGDFWIANDPQRPGLTVATGGSGHGFKFGPVLGDLVANAVEGANDPRLDRFRWRPEAEPAREQARSGVSQG